MKTISKYRWHKKCRHHQKRRSKDLNMKTPCLYGPFLYVCFYLITVLVAGLNDIRDTTRLYMERYTLEVTANLDSKDIMSSIKGLHRFLLQHSANHNVKSTLVVLHVPALYLPCKTSFFLLVEEK